jgi:hypothetical protein
LTCRSRVAQPASPGAEPVGDGAAVTDGDPDDLGEAAADAEAEPAVGDTAVVAGVVPAEVVTEGDVAGDTDALQPATTTPRQATPSQRTIIQAPLPGERLSSAHHTAPSSG